MNTICPKCTGETVENGVCRNCGYAERKDIIIEDADGYQTVLPVAEEGQESVSSLVIDPGTENEETIPLAV